MKELFFTFYIFITHLLVAQYAAPAGQIGTTAIHKDSSIIVGWAINSQVHLGWMNLADTSLGKVNSGLAISSLGQADGDVVSLGDGGEAILEFAHPIANGLGWDFVVFENSFDGHFLELAFVEVSSDGINFVRFPAHSLTITVSQLGSFDTINPRQINNLAGKYQAAFGTPFDLQDLAFSSVLDLNSISHIRIIDVIGSVNDLFCSFDTAGNKINDPWPTPFASGGFDLDAIGVINQSVGFQFVENESFIRIYPNPTREMINLESNNGFIDEIQIYNSQGKLLSLYKIKSSRFSVDLSAYANGVYIIKLTLNSGRILHRNIVLY